MSDREAGWLALAAGIVFVLLAAFADIVGYGPGGDDFGLGQVIVTIVGVALIALGAWRLCRVYRPQ